MRQTGSSSPQPQWQLAWDGASGRWFYKDVINSKAVWEKPGGCDLELPKEPPPGAVKQSELPQGWKTAWDQTQQRVYFFKDGCSPQWHRPVDEQGTGQAQPGVAQSQSPMNTIQVPGVPQATEDVAVSPVQAMPANGTVNATTWEPAWCGKKKKWYYKDTATQKGVWEKPSDYPDIPFPADPPDVPPGFSAAWHPQKGRFWYFDMETHESVGWTVPQFPKSKESQSPDAARVDTKPLEQGSSKQHQEQPASGMAKEETSLPPGWAKQWDEKRKRYYYFNHSLNKTQWELPKALETSGVVSTGNQPTSGSQAVDANKAAEGRGGNGIQAADATNKEQRNVATADNVRSPEALPEGWEKAWDKNHQRDYFYHRGTGKVTWQRPAEDSKEEQAAIKTPSVAMPAEPSVANSLKELPTPQSQQNREANSSKKAQFSQFTQELDRFQLNLLLQRVNFKMSDSNESVQLSQVVDYFWGQHNSKTTTFQAFYEFLQSQDPTVQ